MAQLRLPPQLVHWPWRNRIHSIPLRLEYLPPPTSEKNSVIAAGVAKNDEIYLLSFKARKEIKSTMLQYKIIHGILPTNSLLHKKVASPSCPFCPSECQTIWHLLMNCTQATSFGIVSRSGTQSHETAAVRIRRHVRNYSLSAWESTPSKKCLSERDVLNLPCPSFTHSFLWISFKFQKYSQSWF